MESMERSSFLKVLHTLSDAVLLFLEVYISTYYTQRTLRIIWLILYARTQCESISVLSPGTSTCWEVMKTWVTEGKQFAVGVKWCFLSHCWHKTAVNLGCSSASTRNADTFLYVLHGTFVYSEKGRYSIWDDLGFSSLVWFLLFLC